jgi:multimeric flavodoxin WrbA
MRIIAISGSPVVGGNTDTALQAVLTGAQDHGAEIELVRLYDLEMAPCDGCEGCAESGWCIIPDDASTLIEHLQGADALVLGTPIYWYHVTGVFKNWVDRTYCVWHQKNLAGKRVAAVIVQHSEGADEADSLMHHWCEGQRCTLLDTVTIDTAGKQGVVAGDEALKESLRALGARLCGA